MTTTFPQIVAPSDPQLDYIAALCEERGYPLGKYGRQVARIEASGCWVWLEYGSVTPEDRYELMLGWVVRRALGKEAVAA